jgi:aryl-alcohol dehydrogenase-like predicted oxidoreductase
VETIAKKRNISMAQVALAWSLSKPFITAPIVGTTSLDKLDDLIKGCEVELSAEEIKEIDDQYKTQSVIGHN